MSDLVSRDDVLKAISNAECQYYWGAEALEAATKIIRALPSAHPAGEVERLRADLQYAMETLQFYADRETWRGEYPTAPIYKDCDGDFAAVSGLLARTTLKDLRACTTTKDTER